MPLALARHRDSASQTGLSQAIVEHLSRSRSYPERPRRVEYVETHISWVFLTDRFVYKLKKPVAFDFLDFTTPELRETACRQEVELNRRLAPSVYLGVVPITLGHDGTPRLGGSGPPIDWVVKMQRLPAARSLEALLLARTLRPTEIAALATTLAESYQQLPPLTVRTSAYRQHIGEQVRGNCRELLAPAHQLRATRVRRIQAAQLRLVEVFSEVLEYRAADGRVVEGHGDLRPEHIYFARPHDHRLPGIQRGTPATRCLG